MEYSCRDEMEPKHWYCTPHQYSLREWKMAEWHICNMLLLNSEIKLLEVGVGIYVSGSGHISYSQYTDQYLKHSPPPESRWKEYVFIPDPKVRLNTGNDQHSI